MKLNGGRHVTGILRGFDPFMNMVIDETVEECKDGTKNNIGMVVSYIAIDKEYRIRTNLGVYVNQYINIIIKNQCCR